MKSMRPRNERQGFTIVELVIAVVVIAILAAITIVSYNGILEQNRRKALEGDLYKAATQLHDAKLRNGSFPAVANDLEVSNEDTTLTYAAIGSGFCVQGTNSKLSGVTLHITHERSIKEGECAAVTMQTFKANHCSALNTYNGSNTDAIIELTDPRGDTPRTYQVAKLADGKCWMLTNLKLGSTSGTTALTPANTNIASNFTLPQVLVEGEQTDTSPRVYGPVTNDSGAGDTNYGYLYNWVAATAGDTVATKPAGSGDAQYSICPAGWRLPAGGVWTSASNEFSNLSARMAGFSSVSDAGYAGSVPSDGNIIVNWLYSGPMKIVYSGARWDNVLYFHGYGVYAALWSRSVHETSGDTAYAFFMNGANAATDSPFGRYSGLAIRCVAG